MPLFKKKQTIEVDKSFDLPELPSFPEVQEIKEALKPRDFTAETIPALPSFPAISSYPQPLQAQPWQKPDIKKTQEIGPEVWQSSGPQQQEIDLTSELGVEPAMQIQQPMPIMQREYSIPQRVQERSARPKEPIFIKIDKFGEALNNFELIRKKVDELNEMLKQTREMRQKEQQEFDEWEKEIIEIKERIRIIDEKLFSKLG